MRWKERELVGLPAFEIAYAGIGAPKYIVVNGNVPRDWEAIFSAIAKPAASSFALLMRKPEDKR